MIEVLDSDDATSASSRRTQASRGTSRSSLKSNTSSAAILARAKAESLKKKVEFTHKEAGLRRQEQDVARALLLLSAEKEYAMAEAEAEFLESAVLKEGSASIQEELHLPVVDSAVRTSNYISHHFEKPETESPKKEKPAIKIEEKSPPVAQPVIPDKKDAEIKPALPSQSVPKDKLPDPPSPPIKESLNSISNMLVKKELVKSGIRKFGGSAGDYRAWKCSFQQATKDLELKPYEELNLVLGSLEGETKSFVQRIYAIHVDRPEVGLKRTWEYLEKKHGSPEAVERDLTGRVEQFQKIPPKGSTKLEEFGYLLLEVQYLKESEKFPGLLALDSSRGLQPLVQKLPEWLQNKWREKGSEYKRQHGVLFPPFEEFVKFIQHHARVQSDPSFQFSEAVKSSAERSSSKPSFTVRKTGVKEGSATKETVRCPIHNTAHDLQDCRAFREKSPDEKISFVKENRLCFRCLRTGHIGKNCKTLVRCDVCSKSHATVMHRPAPSQEAPPAGNQTPPTAEHDNRPQVIVTPKCTRVCGNGNKGRSCAKICLAKAYLEEKPNHVITTYVIIDDQSDGSLINGNLLERLGVQQDKSTYAVKTVNGLQEVHGRKLAGLVIESMDSTVSIPAPTLFECNNIPGDVAEIPTPEVAAAFDHLRPITSMIPPLNKEADIAILLGRDAPQFHKVREVINGKDDQPWAHRLDLGWVIVGEVCLNGAHVRTDISYLQQDVISTYFTQVLRNGRHSAQFQPCDRAVQVFHTSPKATEFGKDLFLSTSADERLGPSSDDREFMELIAKEMKKDQDGYWCAPLPLRKNRRRLPNNKAQAISRMKALASSLAKDEKKRQHYVEFMKKILEKGLAKWVQDETTDTWEEVWYLPHFGVYHPQKPDKLRVVFDSSAVFAGVSLNDVLLSGPDLMNQLLGVLIRFREEPVAVTADIEQMFYAFKVREDHTRFLRFLWYKDNNPNAAIVTYCMTVHVFGNKPSPAVAISGLRKTGEEGEAEFGTDVKELIERNFYMDDLLKSSPTKEEAVDVLKRTKNLLSTANVRLHKFASSNADVLAAFEPSELAPNLAEADLSSRDKSTIQRTLGVSWDLKADSFTFQIAEQNTSACTKRTVLSEVNGVFDPIGLAAPVIIKGKMLLREMTQDGGGWDDPLPKDLLQDWVMWRKSLIALTDVRVPRSFAPFPTTQAVRRELHTFGDASNKAIGAVCYLRTVGVNGEVHVQLVMGKAKLAPKAAVTIPRLELCASVLATEIADYVTQELQAKVDESKFYTDSKVVLGYITNTKRRFRTYVCNRVNQLLKTSRPEQWAYVPSERNPADLASRSIPASELSGSIWIAGPESLRLQTLPTNHEQREIEILPDDPEVSSEISCNKVILTGASLGSERWAKFSTWDAAMRATTNLIHIANSFSAESDCKGWHVCEKAKSVKERVQAETAIIKSVQSEAFAAELVEYRNGKVTKKNKLASLNPYLDSNGILRVGGRLQKAQLSERAAHPAVLPKNNHVTKLIIKHFHQQCSHQGRHITLGTIRNEGYWVLGGQRQITKVIQDCVTCKRLRGKRQDQIMADLPEERVTVAPPFTFVGVDVFGPFEVYSRKTRGCSSRAKRWAALFTCMVTRGVHIEVLEAMDSSCFINALRRFFSIRGPARQIRSDCGTNFVGACNEIGRQLQDKEPIKRYLLTRGCEWVFNPPHASHMGGAWERMIGISRRILEGILRDVKPSQLTHEVFTTLMAEVAAIINSRPLLPDSNTPELPLNLSPNALLTMKPSQVTAPEGPFDPKDLMRTQWRRVQHLSNMFWDKWQKDYLPLLQTRAKWQQPKRDMKEGDVVIVKGDYQRNDWPLGRVVGVEASGDRHIRKASVEMVATDQKNLFLRPARELTKKTLLRPISDLVLLIPSE